MIVKPVADDSPSFADEVLRGLNQHPKSLPCRFFYDDVGSKIFDEISTLPEYYLTRAEHSVLAQCSNEIAEAIGNPATLVELGSGSAEKTRLIIEALLAVQDVLSFIPIDIAEPVLEASARELLNDYPRLQIEAIAGEYEDALEHLSGPHARPRLIAWLGSSIGNFRKPEAADFLHRIREWMSSDDRMLVGIDLRKDRERLERAYDDSQGVTARFNKNLLTRINRELNANFDIDSFSFEARYRESTGSVESYLVSDNRQTVEVRDLNASYEFAAGERIHTEDSHKFSHEEIEALAARAGLKREIVWTDAEGLFSLNLFSKTA